MYRGFMKYIVTTSSDFAYNVYSHENNSDEQLMALIFQQVV